MQNNKTFKMKKKTFQANNTRHFNDNKEVLKLLVRLILFWWIMVLSYRIGWLHAELDSKIFLQYQYNEMNINIISFHIFYLKVLWKSFFMNFEKQFLLYLWIFVARANAMIRRQKPVRMFNIGSSINDG